MFTKISLKNPASVLVVSIVIVLFGFISAFKLPIQLVPDIERPQITISSGWRSAAPEELEESIVEPIENAVKNTQGVIDVSTDVYREFATTVLTFRVGENMQNAVVEVLNRLNQVPPLPIDAYEPIVTIGGGGDGPGSPPTASFMITHSSNSETIDFGDYQKLFDDFIEPRFSRIPGIGKVDFASERPQELRVTFDPYKAAALGLTISDFKRALNDSKNRSSGVASVGKRQYTVRFKGQFTELNVEKLILGYSNGSPIYLGDVATVEKTLIDRPGFSIRTGKPSYFFKVHRQSGANTVDLLDEIKIAIKELNAGPLKEAGLNIELSFDASQHIRNALKLVKNNLGFGVLLSLFVLWLFLRSYKSSLIIACSIPFSIFISLIALNMFGRTLNVISLAGLALSVGLVLDASIVVLEAIKRRRELGDTPTKAAIEGTRKVSGALFASTITSVIIFLPIVFMEGIEGQLFTDLALTLSISVTTSFFVATAVIPLASLYFLYSEEKPDPYEKAWKKASQLIMRVTDTFAKRIFWVAGLLGGAIVISILLVPKADFMPRAPIDGFFMSFDIPPGSNLDFIEKEVSSLVKERLSPYVEGEKSPQIKSYNFYSVNGGSTGGFVYAKDPSRVEELMDTLRTDVFQDIPETSVYLIRGSMINISGSGGRNIDINLTGTDINGLFKAATEGLSSLKTHFAGATAFTIPSKSSFEPELSVVPLEERISNAGLTKSQVADAVTAYTTGLFIKEFFDGNKRFNVILRGPEWSSPDELASMPIFSPSTGTVRVDTVSAVKRGIGPSQLRRVDGKRTITIRVVPPSNVSIEQANQIITESILPKIVQMLPNEASVILHGQTKEMSNAKSEMLVNFLLAVLILILVMSAIFKSAKDSVIAMLVMPIAIAGGVTALWLLNFFTFQSLDLLTMIGFIILIGLIVNNSILIVDETRQNQRSGMQISAAVESAILVRTRPIYMSTLTSLLGMLPLMLMPGTGSEIYRGLATVIVGGMVFSAIFTLILLPSLLRMKPVGFSLLSSKSTSLPKTQ